MIDTRAPLTEPLAGYEPLKSRVAKLGDPSQAAAGFVARQARDHTLFRAGPYAIIALDQFGR